jgi:hypothetical protein
VADGTRRARSADATGPVGRTGVADNDEAATDGCACFVTDGNAPGADEDVSPGGIPFPGGDAADDHGDTADGGAAVYNRTGTAVGSGADAGSDVDCAARASACATRSDTVRRSATATSDECAPDDRDRDADNRVTDQRTASQHNHTAAATSHQHATSIHQHIDQPASHNPVSRPCWRWIRTR